MMQSTSREALRAVQARVDQLIANPSTDLMRTAQELGSVAEAVRSQPRLRRVLADPASAPAARSGLLSGLLAGKVGPEALDVAGAVVHERWSSPGDLVVGLTDAAERLLLGAAERSGSLDEVEDELFRFSRILGAQPELSTLLDDLSVPYNRRASLLASVVGGKVGPVTQALLLSALATQTHAGITSRVEALVGTAAAMQQRSIAIVRSAVPLSDAQESRLAAALGDIYRRQIAVRTQVDPSVLGGLVIRVGDEQIDGSIAARLAAARGALADS
jgi:F-type H+-transporting ATPase subunit delta